jgi:two-component system sensor kinase FixL
MKGSRRLLEESTDERSTTLREAMDRAAEQALRAGQVIRRLRDFVARGESDRRVEDVKKLVEEASALALVGVIAGIKNEQEAKDLWAYLKQFDAQGNIKK